MEKPKERDLGLARNGGRAVEKGGLPREGLRVSVGAQDGMQMLLAAYQSTRQCRTMLAAYQTTPFNGRCIPDQRPDLYQGARGAREISFSMGHVKCTTKTIRSDQSERPKEETRRRSVSGNVK